MKKNILLVQSFLVLPLLTTSSAFGMQLIAAKGTQKELSVAQQATDSIEQQKATTKGFQPLSKSEVKKNKLSQKIKTVVTAEAPLTEELTTPHTTTPVDTPQLNNSQEIVTSSMPTISEVIVTKERAQEIVPLSTSSHRTPMPLPKKKVNAPLPKRLEYLVAELTEQEVQEACQDVEDAKNRAAVFLDINTSFLAAASNLRRVETHKKTPKTIEEKQAPIITIENSLEKSVMTSTENTTFSYFERFSNALKTYAGVVIGLLENDTFDLANAIHKQYFNNALEECARNKDLHSLVSMLDICEKKEKYQLMQSAINHVAPAFNYVAQEYQAQIMQSNKHLIAYNQACAEKINQASNTLEKEMMLLLDRHRNTVTELAKAFDAEVIKEQEKEASLQRIARLTAALNAQAQPYYQKLVETHYVISPTNSTKEIEGKTQEHIRHLITRRNMPKAKGILQIDNK